jgi:alanine-glyoxylate transaminase/serine-glyoxylate transaminase/serine-pyruvate transaminase
VVCFRYGQFSHLWIDQAQRLGLDVVVLEEEWGRGADEARLEAVLKADTEKKIKAVMVVHNETTTGVTSDIHGCRKAIDNAKHPALFFVDGVRSQPPRPYSDQTPGWCL